MEQRERVSRLEKLMDDPWLLLVLGLLIPFLSYTLWGLVELMRVAPDKLP
jgi:hypothetical protein